MNNKDMNYKIGEITGFDADYCADLNAMHEAEKVLDGGLKPGSTMFRYTVTLHKLTNGMGHLATAAQRAEAFLKCLGKWEEE